MNRPLDVLFVNADSAATAYQELARDFSAIEPPTWALLLAQSCRAKGFGVALIDCGAERLSEDAATKRIGAAKARLVCSSSAASGAGGGMHDSYLLPERGAQGCGGRPGRAAIGDRAAIVRGGGGLVQGDARCEASVREMRSIRPPSMADS